jgi:molecular chaperone DnaJ
MAKDLYAVLGLSKGASVDEVKQAYRKMSKEWHPDKHKGDKKAEEKFKEINEAYEILGNEKKKQMYDQFGATGSGPGSGSAGFGGFDFSGFQGAENLGDIASIFENFFGGGRSGGRGRSHSAERGADHEATIEVPLSDVVRGVDRTVSFRRQSRCGACEGSGKKSGTDMIACATCGGTGQVVHTTQSFFGAIRQSAVCGKCHGSGKVPKEPCAACGGDGRVSEKATVTVRVPPGIDDGQTLRVEGQGDAGRRRSMTGDLYVHVRVVPDKHFERNGADLASAATVHVLDAILGADIDVATVHGNLKTHIPEGTQPGTVLRLKGKGLPVLGSSRMGDHYVTINIEIPKKLSREERKVVEEWRKMH